MKSETIESIVAVTLLNNIMFREKVRNEYGNINIDNAIECIKDMENDRSEQYVLYDMMSQLIID